jgi:hypothetical protein
MKKVLIFLFLLFILLFCIADGFSASKYKIYTVSDIKWMNVAKHLRKAEDAASQSKLYVYWVNANIRPLEREFDEKGPSDDLYERMMAIKIPNPKILDKYYMSNIDWNVIIEKFENEVEKRLVEQSYE